MKYVINADTSNNAYRSAFEATQQLSNIKNASTKLLEALDFVEKLKDPGLGRGSAIINKVKGHIFDSYELLEEAERLYTTTYDL